MTLLYASTNVVWTLLSRTVLIDWFGWPALQTLWCHGNDWEILENRDWLNLVSFNTTKRKNSIASWSMDLLNAYNQLGAYHIKILILLVPEDGKLFKEDNQKLYGLIDKVYDW